MFAVRSPNVVSEIIDGELIILDVASGSYHATDGVGAALWELAAAGLAEEQILAACEAAWPGIPVATAVRTFLDHLVDIGLLAISDGGMPAGQQDDIMHIGHIAWEPPTLSSCDDLADMIQLDPIHDVTDTGWPTARSVQ